MCANYTQWAADPKVSRVYWASGSERLLVDMVISDVRKVVAAPEIDSVSFWADGHKDSSRKIWDEVFQHSLTDGSKLVTVRNAELLDLSPMKDFVGVLKAELSKTSVLLVASGAEALENAPFLTANNTKTIKCSMPNAADLLDLVQSWTRVSEMSARLLLNWTGGELYATHSICEKINLIPGDEQVTLSKDILRLMCDEVPGEFVEALLADDKRAAIAAAQSMSLEEFPRVVTFLDSRLGTISEVLAFARGGGSLRSARSIVGVPYPSAKAVLPYAPRYDSKRIKRCRTTLALLDSLYRDYVGAGLWETLVVLW